jgi:hypothetical protein
MSFEGRENHESVLGALASGEVVIDRPRSHLKDDPTLTEYLPQALERMRSEEREFISDTVDFGTLIGTTDCVEVTEHDEVFLAQRSGRKGPSRFVLNRLPEPSSELSVVLKKVADKKYILITAYVGPLAGPEPWDQNATPESNQFWKRHALVWSGEAEVLPKEKQE